MKANYQHAQSRRLTLRHNIQLLLTAGPEGWQPDYQDSNSPHHHLYDDQQAGSAMALTQRCRNCRLARSVNNPHETTYRIRRHRQPQQKGGQITMPDITYGSPRADAVLSKLDQGSLTVRVEQWHIDQGAAKDERCCPIALALNEATGSLFDSKVYANRAVLAGVRQYQYADPAIGEWIGRYDGGDPVEPIAVRLSGNHIHGYRMEMEPPTPEPD